uniref:C-type lectin domain-containing protein n=1 Tax=Salarias fasciatus TaxID=181472 RepID=A0A672G8V7_SALFA
MFNPGFLLAADFHCDSGYLLYGNFCYFFKIEDVKNWANAEAECVKEQGHLASFHSEEEFSFLIGDKWIGYSWSDGTPLSHTNWADGEPNNHEGREECVEMVSSPSGTYSWWNDLNCDAHQDWICKINRHSVLTHRWPHTPRAQVFHNLGPQSHQ